MLVIIKGTLRPSILLSRRSDAALVLTNTAKLRQELGSGRHHTGAAAAKAPTKGSQVAECLMSRTMSLERDTD